MRVRDYDWRVFLGIVAAGVIAAAAAMQLLTRLPGNPAQLDALGFMIAMVIVAVAIGAALMTPRKKPLRPNASDPPGPNRARGGRQLR
jgi:hypothetical protein